jgi:acetoin utilization protein AcuB
VLPRAAGLDSILAWQYDRCAVEGQPTLVGNIMQVRLVTVTPETDLGEALARMAEHGVRRLPVVRTLSGETVLVGIVTDRDVRLAVDSPYGHPDVTGAVQDLRKLTVSEVMTADPVTVFPTASAVVAATLMLSRRIGGLPVVEQEEGRNYLVGIVTRTDLLQLLVALETKRFPA